MSEMTREEALEKLRDAGKVVGEAYSGGYGDMILECVQALEAPAEADRDAEERRAWDMYAAGLLAAADLTGTVYAAPLARVADHMLTERRERFPKGGV